MWCGKFEGSKTRCSHKFGKRERNSIHRIKHQKTNATSTNSPKKKCCFETGINHRRVPSDATKSKHKSNLYGGKRLKFSVRIGFTNICKDKKINRNPIMNIVSLALLPSFSIVVFCFFFVRMHCFQAPYPAYLTFSSCKARVGNSNLDGF